LKFFWSTFEERTVDKRIIKTQQKEGMSAIVPEALVSYHHYITVYMLSLSFVCQKQFKQKSGRRRYQESSLQSLLPLSLNSSLLLELVQE
jgi:hypothetical protein